MPGVFDRTGWMGARNNAHIAFGQRCGVGAQNDVDFELSRRERMFLWSCDYALGGRLSGPHRCNQVVSPRADSNENRFIALTGEIRSAEREA
jgi:hypothetical protein